jgi:hypothetical protein
MSRRAAREAMSVDLSSLEIIEAVIHDVPRPDGTESLLLTDSPVALDPDLNTYFHDKLLESLGGRGVAIEADSDEPAAVREGVQSILADPSTHVRASQAMATHLYKLQKRTNSPGLLTVIRARAGGEEAIGVLKLEREVGVHVLIEEVGDQRIIDLEFLRDLTLTRKTRVFKAAVLRLNDPVDPLSMLGLASDDQRSRVEARGLARFFLNDFLGCHLTGSPEKATHDFWNAAQAFVNSDVASPERQGRYQVAIQAYLEEPDEQIAPEAFIHRAIDENDRPRLRQRLRDEGLDPRRAIAKDTALIAKKIEGFRLTFDHGMLLIGRRDDLAAERLELPSDDHPGPTRIHDSIRKFMGR